MKSSVQDQEDHAQSMHVQHLDKRSNEAAQADQRKARHLETY